MLCTSVVSWVVAGLRKAAIGPLGGGLGTEAALGIEPVTSSLAGASLPPLVLFRIAKKPNTRIATTLEFLYRYATSLGIGPNENQKPWQQWMLNRAQNGLGTCVASTGA